jgi:hypothetical protein
MGYRDYEESWQMIDQTSSKASEYQIAGNHYRDLKIQPAYFCHVNNIPYLEATAIKYLCRWRKKNGIEDLRKAKHFIDLLIEFENADTQGT